MLGGKKINLKKEGCPKGERSYKKWSEISERIKSVLWKIIKKINLKKKI